MKPFIQHKVVSNLFVQSGVDPQNTETLYERDYQRLQCNSVSTKPWVAGKPTVWTDHFWRRDSWPVDEGQFSRSFAKYGPEDKPVSQFTSGTLQWGVAGTYTNGIDYIPDREYDDVDVNAIRNSLLGKIKSQKWNAANALGEVRSTVDMIANRLNRIASSFLALKRGNVGKAWSDLGLNSPSRRQLAFKKSQRWPFSRERYNERAAKYARTQKERDLASAYVELTWGWLPLLSDIYEAKQGLDQIQEFRTRVKSSRKIQQSLRKVTSGTRYGTDSRYTIYETTSWSVFRSGTVEYSFDDAFGKHIVSLGLTNPLALAWELTPLSCVVDWVLPIGSWLGNFDATFSATFKRGAEVNHNERNREIVVNVEYSSSAFGGGSGRGYGRSVWVPKYHSRSLTYSFPKNTLSFKNPVSARHAATALALLTQAFLGRK